MILFFIGGLIYGMVEEIIFFYGLLSVIMVVVGFDMFVVVGIVLLGVGLGVIGLMVNFFFIGVVMDVL